MMNIIKTNTNRQTQRYKNSHKDTKKQRNVPVTSRSHKENLAGIASAVIS